MIKRVVLYNLPLSVRGYCYNDEEGEKVCVLNARYTYEDNLETYQHEREHVKDFGVLNVDLLESIRHK